VGWGAKHNPRIPGIVGDNREDLGRELRVIGVPIIDQLKSRHHCPNGFSDLMAAIRSLRGWQISGQANRDFTFGAHVHIVSAAYRAGGLMHRLGQNGTKNRLTEAHHLLHDRRCQGDFVPSDGAMGGSHARMEGFLHRVRFINMARRKGGRKRSKGLAGSVRFAQELGCLYNPMLVSHPVFS
jgi:hypothetical protein